MSNLPFEEVEHTADWALRVKGRDLHELLLNAAVGMTSLLVARPDELPTNVEKRFELEAFDAENLLVEWLSELVYWTESEQLIFSRFELTLPSPLHLQAVAWGGYAPDLQKQIKAVTYHRLKIVATAEGGVETTIIFDV